MWLIGTVDRLLAGLCIAVVGVFAAQLAPFAAQYTARATVDVERAQARLADIETGLRYQTVAEQVRAELLADARRSLVQAGTVRDAVAEATPALYPYVLWRSADPALRRATWEGFVPSLPQGPWAAALTVIGALLGFGVYEGIKWPVVALLRAPRRRFKKRGGLI